jgi:hypothetical protein
MKHASDAALDALDSLLAEVRQCQGLIEKKRGIFYRKSKAFLHFHEDPGGLFADLRQSDDWQRFPVNSPAEQEVLLQAIWAIAHS